MKTYLFITNAQMRTKGFWIDNDIIKDIYIKDEDLQKAIIKYLKIIQEDFFCKTNKTTYKTKQKIYKDDNKGNPSHIGYIFKVNYEIKDKITKMDIWVTIKEVINPF